MRKSKTIIPKDYAEDTPAAEVERNSKKLISASVITPNHVKFDGNISVTFSY
jgi:hypothetical protein